MVNGVAKAIKESKAFKIYVSNIMTTAGQTDNYTLSDHIKAINEHAGKGVIKYCIYDTGEVVPEYIKKYNLEGQDLVDSNVDKVKGIIIEQLGIDDESKITMQTTFIDDLGADSLDVVELIMALEEEFEIEIPELEAEKIASVSDVVDYIKSVKE